MALNWYLHLKQVMQLMQPKEKLLQFSLISYYFEKN